ncbi:MAG: efflux RND transporter periplasmic adaptor subunit [bacterium]|nr:efflux RND transporter periplasmic adaptor subunit [bacterium]MCP5065752.1 efflux RND transporter periplasmic adaptor subunit [bacterium]
MNANKLRRILQVAIGGTLLTGAVVWLSGGCRDRIGPGVSPEQIRKWSGATAVVTRTDDPVTEWASGTVASARHTAVAARILATIREVRVRAGSEVRAGDLLIVLDAEELAARTAGAAEALRGARARLTLATQEMERAGELLAEGVGTKQQADRASSDLRVAAAEVERLEQAQQEASTTASYAEIRSPVSGRVVDRLAEPGDTVVPGRSLLHIYDPSVLRVEVPVRESLAVALDLGQTLRVTISALDTQLSGVVDEIVPFADPGARTLLARVRLPADGRLYAGMYARVAIPAGTRERLMVPQGSVQRVGQLESVLVVNGEGHAERRLVTTAPGEKGDTEVEVLSGISDGEQVAMP